MFGLHIREQVPAPGYQGIAWMTLNRTWDDIQNEWWWLDDNTFEFSWFGFDTTQSFEMAFVKHIKIIYATLKGEFHA